MSCSCQNPLLIAQLIICIILISGCDRSSPPPVGHALPSGGRVAFIGPPRTDPACQAILGGATEAARGIGALRFDFLAPADPGANAVLEELERALAPEPAALCVYFGSESLARAAADSLSRYRGVLVTINSAPPGVESFAHVAADWCQGAESLADAINSALEKLDRRSFVLLHADGRSELETNIFRRFRSAMSRFTRVQLLDQAVLGTSIPPRSPAEQVAAMLERFRHAGLAVTLDPAPWIAPALYRLEEPHHFATLGASPVLWPRLRSGEAVALVGPHEGELGRIAIERAIRGLTGDSDARGSVLVPCEVVTPDTFEAFRAKYERFASPARARP